MHLGAACSGLHAHLPGVAGAVAAGRRRGWGTGRLPGRPLQLLAGHLQMAAVVAITGDAGQRCLILLVSFQVSGHQGGCVLGTREKVTARSHRRQGERGMESGREG